jgi:uncharacterized lipoprotein YmbA
MTNRPYAWKILCAFFIVALFSAGCGTSRPVELFTLNPLTSIKEKTPGMAVVQDISIGVGPVALPEFLDRPQIVTRTSPNRLHASAFHRWAGSLQANFSAVLAENISILMATNRVAVYPWADQFSPTYSIKLEVQQFDGRLGEYVLLNATWMVMERESGNPTLVKKSVIREPVSSKDYEALVAAKSHALAILSREIVEEIRRLEPAQLQ